MTQPRAIAFGAAAAWWLGVGGSALAQAMPVTVTYICERGVEVPVSYTTPEQGEATAVLYVENRMVTLVRTRAASGARYAWPSDGSGYVWWTKGDAATLFWHDAAAEEDVTLYAACQAR
ncbi:MliC family protein [Sulfitobacter pontiacus]|uniref:MliC family protein n=1 Tax=Sulfitobacter pontiacus TaxID=60137 RepID=UPI0030EDCCE4